MRLNLITEDKDVLLVEEMLQSGVVNEDALDLVDDAVEVVFGAAGFIPVAGDFTADLSMVIKNLIQGDYLGAAIFLISMEPSPVSDAIGKGLRLIQKIARYTGKEDELNEKIAWLVKETGGKQTQIVMNLFKKSGDAVSGIDNKLEKGKKSGEVKTKKASGIVDTAMSYIADNFDKMEAALREFMELIENKVAKMEPSGGIDDMPDKYVSDLIERINNKYHELRESDLKNGTSSATLYKKKLRANANKRPEVKVAYEEIFGPIPEIE